MKPSLSNLRGNLFLPFSAVACFYLGRELTPSTVFSLLLVFVAATAVALVSPSPWERFHREPNWRKTLTAATALGVCWWIQSSVHSNLGELLQRTPAAIAGIDLPPAAPHLIGLACAVLAFAFVYFYLAFVFKTLHAIFRDGRLLDDLHPAEKILYPALLLLTFAFVTCCFARSEVFYAHKWSGHDIIYSSDTPVIVPEYVYLDFLHPENDLRQPLFAVFASPFMGIPYLLGKILVKLLGPSALATALPMNLVQILMLFTGIFLTAKAMGLSPLKRLCFILLACSSYTYLLFVLMMEQYIVAYFWLMLFIFTACLPSGKASCLALLGAGGTLLPSLALLPLGSSTTPGKDLKRWFRDMVANGAAFLALMVLFCRGQIVYGFAADFARLQRFSGKGVPFSERFRQFTIYLHNCFLAPAASAVNLDTKRPSWQLEPPDSMNLAGLLLLLLAITSIFLNRRKKSTWIAAGWLALSSLVLLVFGWGTYENGLILYSLYFGWPLLVLLFQLLERCGERFHPSFSIPVVSVLLTLLLLASNIPGIRQLTRFSLLFQ